MGTKPAILLSSLQFVAVGKVTQLIGRDILTNQDVTLATFDNVYFDENWLSDDWQRTSKLLKFNLIGAPSRAPRQRNSKQHSAAQQWIGIAISLALAMLIAYLRGLTK